MESKRTYEEGMDLTSEELLHFTTENKKEALPNAIEPKNINIQKNLYFTLCLNSVYKFRIYKPLIPLKLALFAWFGAGAIVPPFIGLFARQRGLTVSDISLIYVIIPFAQILTTTVLGIIADKIGRSKPVLLMCLVGCIAVITGFLLTPRINTENCPFDTVNLECNNSGFTIIATTYCNVSNDFIQVRSCKCQDNTNDECLNKSLCGHLASKEFQNFSIDINFINSNRSGKFCNFDAEINSLHTWCDTENPFSSCKISCIGNSSQICANDNQKRTLALSVQFLLFFLFFVSHASVYQFFDVTTMFSIATSNEDYGQQRFWGIIGSLLLPLLAGHVVDLTSEKETEKNYSAAFYVFICGTLFTIITVCFLDVHVQPPGKMMRKKALFLIKNIDNFAFLCALFILGSSWGFKQIFTYLYIEDLGSSGLLIGLLKSMNSLYGLPFLMTAHWWVKKIGTENIIVLAFLGYSVHNIGLSFLVNPWFSLLLETTFILSYHLLWVAVVQHCYDIAPEGLRVTINAFACGLHFNFGRSSGSIIGGTIMSYLGGRIAHRIMGFISLFSAALYSIFLYLRCRHNKKENQPL